MVAAFADDNIAWHAGHIDLRIGKQKHAIPPIWVDTDTFETIEVTIKFLAMI